MRKINFTVAFPISVTIDVPDDCSYEQILVEIIKQSVQLDPTEHDGMVIQEVLDSRLNNNNVIHKILEIQDQLEADEEYYNFLAEEEDKKNNENYYRYCVDQIDNLF